jgi:serine protease Do
VLALGGALLLRRAGDGGETPRRVEELRREVAGELDGAAIHRANGPAVALVLARYGDGRTWSGTGFAVRSDRDGGFLVTSRHLVRDSSGAGPTRLEVVFDGSGRSAPARVVAVHPSADLALVRIERAGGVPVVRGLATDAAPVRVGAPVASLGFPLGLDLPMGGDWRRVGVSATLTTGTAARVLPGLLQIDGYGATGASGSPVFRADGKVVGVIYGDERESGGRIVYAAPARAIAELLAWVTRAAAR